MVDPIPYQSCTTEGKLKTKISNQCGNISLGTNKNCMNCGAELFNEDSNNIDISEITSVIDSNGDEYYEVESLTQDTVFERFNNMSFVFIYY